MSIDLRSHRGRHRPLLIFSPSRADHRYETQRTTLDTAWDAACDRDIVVREIVGEHDRQERARFGVDADVFAVVLVGKDGTVKMRSAEPVSARDLFDLIDAMPMRRREMGERGR